MRPRKRRFTPSPPPPKHITGGGVAGLSAGGVSWCTLEVTEIRTSVLLSAAAGGGGVRLGPLRTHTHTSERLSSGEKRNSSTGSES